MKQFSKPKVLAMYLPQFHETPENNQFWGKGFTDWHSVKHAESYFEGHVQPKVPLDENYYDLSDPSVIKQQAILARNYGIDGFCIYHYWFENDKKVLYKPAEILLANPEIDINYCFMWDNNSWIRSWSKIDGNAWAPAYEKPAKEENDYLLKVEYGSCSQWKKHFEYLLPFFMDCRYIKIDNKPVFGFFSTKNGNELRQMGEYWDKLAIENGFCGMYLISRNDPFIQKNIFKTEFIYQPAASTWQRRDAIVRHLKKYFPLKKKAKKPICYDYDKVWKRILLESKMKARKEIVLCGFVNYDDTPRRGVKGKIIVGGNPEKFGKYFKKLYELSCDYQKDILFLMAWNEWGEGAYMEPDQKSKFLYLQEIDKIVNGIERRG